MNILSLDTATITGWAFYSDVVKKKPVIKSGIIEFPFYDFDDYGVPIHFFRSWLESFIKVYHIENIIFEQPTHRGVHTKLLMGFIGVIMELCAIYSVQWIEIPGPTLKKYARIKGFPEKGAFAMDKDLVMEAGKNMGWKFVDDNECDALWMLDYLLEEQKK